MKFLIADDSLFMRNIILSTIHKLGHEVIGQASNGTEAEELYFKHKPDVLTMDISMPDVNGLEGAHAILSKDPNAKIIMISALGQSDIVTEAVKLGVYDFIVKPINDLRLREIIIRLERELTIENLSKRNSRS